MRIRSMATLAAAAALVVPLVGTTSAFASPRSGTEPTCVIHAIPNHMVETGEGTTASSIAGVLQVECQPVYGEDNVTISATQLDNTCHGTLSWYSDAAGENGWGTGDQFTVMLDDDGNAWAAFWGGPSCAAAPSTIYADLDSAPYTTVSTVWTTISPRVTMPGVTANPASIVEDATYSGVATVVRVEFPAKFARQTVEISDFQLNAACGGNLTWYGPDEQNLGTGPDTTVTLDNDGNAFAVAVGTGCAAVGTTIDASLITAPPYTTYIGHFTIRSPKPTV